MPKTAKESGKEVELFTLETLQPFKFQGKVYTKRRVRPGGITCLSKKGDKLITLSPDTLVTIEVKAEVEPELIEPGEPGAEEPGAEPGSEEPGAEEPGAEATEEPGEGNQA